MNIQQILIAFILIISTICVIIICLIDKEKPLPNGLQNTTKYTNVTNGIHTNEESIKYSAKEIFWYTVFGIICCFLFWVIIKCFSYLNNIVRNDRESVATNQDIGDLNNEDLNIRETLSDDRLSDQISLREVSSFESVEMKVHNYFIPRPHSI